MTLGGIYTLRDSVQPYYWQVVFEWEDQLSKTLNVPLVPVGRKYDRIYKPSILQKLINRLNGYQWWDRLFFKPKKYFLAFHIGPPGVYSFHSRRDVIPWIIDFWKHEDLSRFGCIFKLSPLVLISSREAFEFLRELRVQVNLEHFPLSLADAILEQGHNVKATEKKFDVIQIGRQNSLLTSYIQKFRTEFPSVDYIYAKHASGSIEMISERSGSLGEFNSREAYFSLLQKSRVSLLSAPGLDGDTHRTGGFSPVTPRFFESLAYRCYTIGVFPENADFKFNEIASVTIQANNYETFRSALLNCLAKPELPDYRPFLSKHLTSKRGLELQEILCKPKTKSPL